MRFSVDDTLVQETTRNKLESIRGPWVFDHNQYVILSLALGGAYSAGWNQVTTPYRGLPQSRVDKVAVGGVQAETDWVRSSRRGDRAAGQACTQVAARSCPPLTSAARGPEAGRPS
jgi:hypothetical protein